MINKKTLIVVGIVTAALLVGATVYSFWYRSTPQSHLTNLIEESKDIDDYLSQNLLSKIKENESGNADYYQSLVENYETVQEVSSIQIDSKENLKAIATAKIITTTTNKDSGYSYKTADTYKVTIIKEGADWKIDAIEKLGTEPAK